MQDDTGAAGGDGAEATFQALRQEFLEDSGEELQNLISFLNEAMAGGRPMAVALRDARRVAVNLIGGGNGFELPLIGVTAQRFDDYIASLSAGDTRGLGNLIAYAETLLDLLPSSCAACRPRALSSPTRSTCARSRSCWSCRPVSRPGSSNANCWNAATG
jgi:hypothetical protein